MSNKNLIRARSHIVFIIALLTAFGFVTYLESVNFENRVSPRTNIKQTTEVKMREHAPLTEQEREWAKIAWQYFINNTTETGLVNSANGYSASTLWDTSSYMMATISAYKLELIDTDEFNQRINLLLESLAELPLFDDALPNKSYSTKTMSMVDYNNKASERGIGWSAIDIGRIYVPFNILAWNYPEFTPKVRHVMSKWNTDALTNDGEMFGSRINKGKTELVQEGRLGYEEYAAKSFQLIGMDVSAAIDYQSWLKYVDIYGEQIPIDSRDPKIYHAHNYVVSEPYILDGIEYGWDSISREFANRVYRVQELRYENTGLLTAVSEDNIDQAPHFVYNTIYTSGKKWNAITEHGKDASLFKTLSTKAAFGWYALFDTPYTEKLIETASTLYDPKKGWYSGQYEVSKKPNKIFTANTNGIILEALAYKQFGIHLKP